MVFWPFSQRIFSKNIENIRIAKERLLWGFWDREAGEKFKRNWRAFIRLYNRIKPFDIAVFQITISGNIHAIGVIKENTSMIKPLYGQLKKKKDKFYIHGEFHLSTYYFQKIHLQHTL